MSDLTPEQPAQPTPGGGKTGVTSAPAFRILLVVLGAGAMIAAPFLPWVGERGQSVAGTEIGVNVFWSASPDFDPGFFASAGLVVLVIGLIALVGVAPGARAFAMLGGMLGVVAAVLVAVSAIRGGLDFGNFRVGLFLAFAGGLVALIGGLLPAVPAGEAVPAEPRRPPAEPPPPA